MKEKIINENDWWTTVFTEVQSLMKAAPESKELNFKDEKSIAKYIEGIKKWEREYAKAVWLWHQKFSKVRFVDGNFYLLHLEATALAIEGFWVKTFTPSEFATYVQEFSDKSAEAMIEQRKKYRIELTVIILAFVVFPWLTLILFQFV